MRQRQTTRGDRWQVRWSQDGKEVSETFTSDARAEKFRGLVEANGQRYPDGWVPRGGLPTGPGGEPTGPTLAEWCERSIASRSRANAQTRHQYRGYPPDHVLPWLAEKAIGR